MSYRAHNCVPDNVQEGTSMPRNTIADMERKMKATIEDFKHDLATLRTGRAAPALLDKISVDYYGAPTPINQLATISV